MGEGPLCPHTPSLPLCQTPLSTYLYHLQHGCPLNQSPSASLRVLTWPQLPSVRSRALLSTTSTQVVGSRQHPWVPPQHPHTPPLLTPTLPSAPRGSCFTAARVGGSLGPLSSPAAPLEGPEDSTLLFESRFESGNLQEAIKV